MNRPVKNESDNFEMLTTLVLIFLMLAIIFWASICSPDPGELLTISLLSVLISLLLLLYHWRLIKEVKKTTDLKRINLLQDEFIQIASHEMITPIATIKGYLSMVSDGLGGKVDPKAQKYLEKVDTNVKQLNLVVDELLDVTKLKADSLAFEILPVDIAKTAQNVAEGFRSMAKEKNLDLQVNMPAEPHPMVLADEQRLAQIINNLISNAIKFTERGGVEINTRTENNRVYCSIKDTGMGIGKNDIKKIFTKFYRVQNKQTHNIAGLGLGLWIAQELMRKMKGQMEFSSELGAGSTFTISFPLYQRYK